FSIFLPSGPIQKRESFELDLPNWSICYHDYAAMEANYPALAEELERVVRVRLNWKQTNAIFAIGFLKLSAVLRTSYNNVTSTANAEEQIKNFKSRSSDIRMPVNQPCLINYPKANHLQKANCSPHSIL